MNWRTTRTVVAAILAALGMVALALASNFLLFAIFLFLAALIYRGSAAAFAGARQRREFYREYLLRDPWAAKVDTRSKVAANFGFGFMLAAVLWMYFGAKFFDGSHWNVVFGIAALLGVPGVLLFAYRQLITGIGEYNAMRNRHDRG